MKMNKKNATDKPLSTDLLPKSTPIGVRVFTFAWACFFCRTIRC